MQTPLVIAHRGNSSTAMENSLESIRSALSLHVDMIEIDIRINRDREFYVMHDKTTGRTAEKSINLEKSTSDDISRVRLKNGEPIPTLASVFKLISGRCALNLEIKSQGIGALVARFLLSSGYHGDVLLSSFNEEVIHAARRVMPSLPTSLIFDVFTSRDVSLYKSQGYDIVSLRKMTVNEKLIDTCHKHGIRVYVWTVDDDREMKKLIGWGVDGIYSNRPGVLKEIISKLQITKKHK
jgi:glycerophosphoryl diester phosphodiesterase